MKYLPSSRPDEQFRRNLVVAGAVAASLGTIAFWVARKARQAERDFPVRGKFVTVDGIRVHYLEGGQGSPVVLLHGNMLHAEDFACSGLMAGLMKNHRVVAIDRPGYGYSERPAGRLWSAKAQAALLQKTLVQLGITEPVVAGHSWGTLVALELALLSEAAVKKLILISGYYYPTMRADVLLAAPAAIPVLGDILRYTVSPLMARMTLNQTVKAMFSPRPVPADFVSAMSREMLLRPKQINADAQDAVFMVPAAARLRKHYGEIKAPVAIFAGDEDKVVDFRAHACRLHEEIRDSEMTVLPGVGHMAHHAAPEQIVAAIGA